MSTTPAMISRSQIALVHLAAKQLGFNDDVYRAILMAQAGVASAKHLDMMGFEAVMAYFTAHGFRSKWTARTFGNRPAMASPAQVEMIRQLWKQYSNEDDEVGLNQWLERSYHISSIRFLRPTDASKAITGLQSMARRRQNPKIVVAATIR